MISIVGLFLVAMVVLAVFGRMSRGQKPGHKPKKCRSCGRYVLSSKGCDCGGKAR